MDIPLSSAIFYTIEYNNENTLHEVSQKIITNINQSHLITTASNYIHDNFLWLKSNAKIIIFFPKEIQSPKQGYLFQNNDDTWYFNLGRNGNLQIR